MRGMNLADYVLSQPGGTAKAACPVLATLATKAKCSPATLYMIAGGHKKPSAVLAGRIADATADAVSRHELRPDIFGVPAKRRRAA